MNNIAPGQQIGPYRIISQIGQGGMATVYKAYHAAMDRYIALKVLPSQLAQNKEFVKRFEQEARTIAKLEHAHILPVYDYGEQGDITYLVMRYLDAGTLKEKIQSGTLSLNDVDKYFSQLASALAYAHEMNVIHRDIKPSNAMVNSRGELFLTDFGIAKLLESTAQFTATGAITGTPAYMSPEQAQGEKLDSRSDIYSLGIVLYEMVTGKVPFEAETPLAVILKHINAPLPPPTTLKPDLPPEIEKVLLKALAKNRDDRFATCDDFLNAWKSALTHTATAQVMTPSPAQKESASPTLAAFPTIIAAPAAVKESPAPQKKPSRLPVFVGVGALALISLCVGALSIHWYNQNQVDRQLTAAAAVTASSPNTSVPSSTSLPQLPGVVKAGEWRSWTARNFVYAIAATRESIIGGGVHGFGFWGFDGKQVEFLSFVNGLPHPYVNALFVEEDDSFWVGTENGLVHVQGGKWTSYGEAEGLHPYITVITRVRNRLLVGTAYSQEGGGLYEFDPQSGRFKAVKFPSVHEDQKGKLSYNVTSIAVNKDGTLWVGTTNGLGRFDGQTWTRFDTQQGLGSERINTVYVDAQDRLWVTTTRGAAQWDGGKFKPVGPNDVELLSIAQDAKGTLWFVHHGGIARLNPADGTIRSFEPQRDNIPEAEYFSVTVSKDMIYFGTSAGILRYSPDGKFTLWTAPNVPSFRQYGRVLPTADGGLLFVERYGGGIDQFVAASQQWQLAKRPPCDCEPLLDEKGVLIAREWDHGLWFITGNERINLKEGLPSNRITTVSPVKGASTLWVGTDAGVAMVQYDNLSRPTVAQTYTQQSAGFAAKEITALFAAADKSVWVGMSGGLSRLTGGKWEHFTVNKPFGRDMNEITDIDQSADGAIWVGTMGDGVYRWKDGNWERFAVHDPGVPLKSNVIFNVTAAPDGSVWFGTEMGAVRFDGKQWQGFMPAPDQLASLMVNEIYVSKSGEVWFLTNGGVSRLKPDSTLVTTPSPSSPGSVLPEVLVANAQLRMGQEMLSINKQYSFKFQFDGDLVVYDNIATKPLWSSNTRGSQADYLAIQNDGNLVLYSKAGAPLWASQTAATVGDYFLMMQDDGNLVLKRGKPYSGNEVPIWATNTAR